MAVPSVFSVLRSAVSPFSPFRRRARSFRFPTFRLNIKIHQRGVQWKQGVVIYIMLYTILLYKTIPIHCTPLRLHPPLMNTQIQGPPFTPNLPTNITPTNIA